MRAIIFSLFLLSAAVEVCHADEIRYGTASWYSAKDACPYNRNPKCPMANGVSIYDQETKDPYFAASWDYPFGTKLKVTPLTHRSGEHLHPPIVVTVTDRGPARRLVRQGRLVDLSQAAFHALAPLKAGVIEVSVERVK